VKESSHARPRHDVVLHLDVRCSARTPPMSGSNSSAPCRVRGFQNGFSTTCPASVPGPQPRGSPRGQRPAHQAAAPAATPVPSNRRRSSLLFTMGVQSRAFGQPRCSPELLSCDDAESVPTCLAECITFRNISSTLESFADHISERFGRQEFTDDFHRRWPVSPRHAAQAPHTDYAMVTENRA